MEPSDVKRRVRHAIDQGRRKGAAHRATADAAARAFEKFLTEVATPVVRLAASIMKAEGYPFTLFTPAGSLRLASDRSADDYIELTLDSQVDPPTVQCRVNRAWGNRLQTDERPLKPETAIEMLTEEDVLAFLMGALEPFFQK